MKDLEKKTHPDLVPFDDLPEIEKKKDLMDRLMNKLAEELWNEGYVKNEKQKCHWFYDRGKSGGLADLGFEENWEIYMNSEVKKEKPLMCKKTGCSYNFEKDCSEGCMILKYLEEEEEE